MDGNNTTIIGLLKELMNVQTELAKVRAQLEKKQAKDDRKAFVRATKKLQIIEKKGKAKKEREEAKSIIDDYAQWYGQYVQSVKEQEFEFGSERRKLEIAYMKTASDLAMTKKELAELNKIYAHESRKDYKPNGTNELDLLQKLTDLKSQIDEKKKKLTELKGDLKSIRGKRVQLIKDWIEFHLDSTELKDKEESTMKQLAPRGFFKRFWYNLKIEFKKNFSLASSNLTEFSSRN